LVKPRALPKQGGPPVAAKSPAPVAAKPGVSHQPSAAATFVGERIKEYGLLGANSRVPGEGRKPLPKLTYEFSQRNHFRFGFDGVEFNRRPSPSACYWVEYGQPSRPAKTFQVELRQALAEICARYGKVGITNSGNSVSRAIIWEAKEMGLPVETVTLEIEGHRVPDHDKRLPHRQHKVSWDRFTEFARSFAETAGCPDAWLALEAFHGQVSSLPHVYCNTRLSVAHSNYDYIKGEIVGPPVWTLSDHEQSTGINRWLLASNLVGVPQVLCWSPELLVAQLTTRTFRDRIRRASVDPPTLAPTEMRWNTFALFKTTYPNLVMAATIEKARNDKGLTQKMDQLQGVLLRAHLGCNRIHHYPLDRFMKHMGIKPDFFDVGVPAHAYFGRVDA
jgi:hypothetical protein